MAHDLILVDDVGEVLSRRGGSHPSPLSSCEVGLLSVHLPLQVLLSLLSIAFEKKKEEPRISLYLSA
jgi:hypothetical protein